jgi:hypothetical protein
MSCIATISKSQKLNFIFFDQDNDRTIEVDLKEYLQQFPELKDGGSYHKIFNLPGLGNFLLSITSTNFCDCFYFRLKIVESEDKEDKVIVKIKEIPSIDLNYKNIRKNDLFSIDNQRWWYVVRYSLDDSSDNHLFHVINLSEEGKIIDQDSFKHNLLSSDDDISSVFWQRREQKIGNVDHHQVNHLIHICYQSDEKLCVCKHGYNATKICIRRRSRETGNYNYKVIDLKTKEELLFNSETSVVHKNGKLYFSTKDESNESDRSGGPGLIFTEVTFPIEDGKTLERKVVIQYSLLEKHKQLNIGCEILHGDYLLLKFGNLFTDCKFVLLNFFSGKSRIFDDEYFKDLFQDNITINTSIYDFHFDKKMVETLDNFLPHDLIKLVHFSI